MGTDPARRARRRAIASFVAAAVCFAAAAGIVAFRHGPGHRFRDVAVLRHDRRDGPGPFGRGAEWGWERGPSRGWDDDGDRGRGGPGGRPMPPMSSLPERPGGAGANAMPSMPSRPGTPPMPGRDGRAPAPAPTPVPSTTTTIVAPGAPEGN